MFLTRIFPQFVAIPKRGQL